MDKLICDRTLQDVLQKTQKGYYNIADIQRINSYIAYLAENLNLQLTIVNPSQGDVLTFSKMTDIIDNITQIEKVWYVAKDTPPLPTVARWDYQKANDVEKNLQALYEFMIAKKRDKVYSGTFRAGSQIKFRG